MSHETILLTAPVQPVADVPTYRNLISTVDTSCRHLLVSIAFLIVDLSMIDKLLVKVISEYFFTSVTHFYSRFDTFLLYGLPFARASKFQ